MAISKTKATKRKSEGETAGGTAPSTGNGMDDSNTSMGNTQWNRSGTPPSKDLTSSSHTSAAWTQRERRRKRLKKKTAQARQLRLFCGLAIGMTALILVVVHVEVSLLMQATNAKETAAKVVHHDEQQQQQRRRMEQALPLSAPHKNSKPVQHKQNDENDKTIGFQKHAKMNGHLDSPVHNKKIKGSKKESGPSKPDSVSQKLSHKKAQNTSQKVEASKSGHHSSKKLTVDHKKEEKEAQAQQAEIVKLQQEIEQLKKTKEEAAWKEKEEAAKKEAEEAAKKAEVAKIVQQKIAAAEAAKKEASVKEEEAEEASQKAAKMEQAKKDIEEAVAKKEADGSEIETPKEASKKKKPANEDKPKEASIPVNGDKPKEASKKEEAAKEASKKDDDKLKEASSKKEKPATDDKSMKTDTPAKEASSKKDKPATDDKSKEASKEADTPAVKEERKLDEKKDNSKEAEKGASKNDAKPKEASKKEKPATDDKPKEASKKDSAPAVQEEHKLDWNNFFNKGPDADKKQQEVEAEKNAPFKPMNPLIRQVKKAVKHAEALGLPKSANFCGVISSQGKLVTPAVVILGMEDTSTALFWHVLRGITPEGLVHEPVGLQPPKHPDIEALTSMDPSRAVKFFNKIPATNHGKWLHESFCLQQQHAQVFKKPNLLGFEWLTIGDVANNNKAVQALKSIQQLPQGSVKVIRYRRNILDMLSRQEAHLVELKEKQAAGPVTLDHQKLLKQLTHWTKQQQAIDDMLEKENIPHLAVDHETLFPFNAWKELLNVTSQLAQVPIPLNVNIDYSSVPPDLRPEAQSKMEQEWAAILKFMKNTKPTALYDIFAAAEDFDHKDGVFWTQQKSIKNYPKIQQVLDGTHFKRLLRNLEYKHDYYGCACNDKEANKQKLWKGWKKGGKETK